jgi:predicted dehydrogenase
VAALTSEIRGKAEVDDVVAAAVEFESGVLGYLGGSWLTPIRKSLQIHGIEGVVLVDQEGGAAHYERKGTGCLARQPVLGDRADTSCLFHQREERGT